MEGVCAHPHVWKHSHDKASISFPPVILDGQVEKGSVVHKHSAGDREGAKDSPLSLGY